MCGICGIFGGDGQPDRRGLVQAMMDRIAHRGPDGEGIAAGESFVVGHRRLAIIDLATGDQPMWSPDKRYVLTYNGEIYNYVELREELIKRGCTFRTASDTEVLLQLLILDGPAAITQLNGMFAFAFIDTQTGAWLVARDQFGIKPFYYTEANGAILFASEIKALLVHPAVEARSNWRAMQHYLTFQFCLHGETLFEGVTALQPGFYMTGTGGTIDRQHRYWDLNFTVDGHHTEQYFRDQLSELLDDSARLQIRSDVPLGAYASGGIDSSVVAALANRHGTGNTPLFHGRFAESDAYDESAYAKIVAKSIEGVYHEVVPTAQEFVDELPDLIYAMDEPVAGPGLFPQYRVSQLAVQHVKVVLGGQGGDEIFAGYARYLVGYLEQALKGAIFETQEEGSHLVTLKSIIPNLPVLQQYRPLMQHFWRDGLFGDMDARYFRLIDRSPDISSLLTRAALDRYNSEQVFADFQQVFNHPDTSSYVNKMTHFDQKTLLPALLQVEDRVSMAVSLESRVPLLDTRIVDLVTGMPPPMKFQDGRTKHIFKKAVEGIIPKKVLKRKDKMGFPVPLSEWMQKGPVRDFVSDVLLSKACRERGLFDPAALEKLIKTEARFARQLWGALCLELWHQRFIDVA